MCAGLLDPWPALLEDERAAVTGGDSQRQIDVPGARERDCDWHRVLCEGSPREEVTFDVGSIRPVQQPRSVGIVRACHLLGGVHAKKKLKVYTVTMRFMVLGKTDTTEAPLPDGIALAGVYARDLHGRGADSNRERPIRSGTPSGHSRSSTSSRSRTRSNGSSACRAATATKRLRFAKADVREACRRSAC